MANIVIAGLVIVLLWNILLSLAATILYITGPSRLEDAFWRIVGTHDG